MFIVHKQVSNWSRERGYFETEEEAQDFLWNEWQLSMDEEIKLFDGDKEMAKETFFSYWSIEEEDLTLITMEHLIEMYDDMLDQCYPSMFNMMASTLLERADPIQYKCGLNDFYDGLRDDYRCEEME